MATSLLSAYEAGMLNFCWASLYLILGGVLAWKTWYKSLYLSLSDGGSTWRWLLFITSYCLHLIFVSLAAIGIQSCALSGFIFMLKTFHKSKTLGVLALVGFGLWALVALLSTLLFKRSWYLFRESSNGTQTMNELTVVNPATIYWWCSNLPMLRFLNIDA